MIGVISRACVVDVITKNIISTVRNRASSMGYKKFVISPYDRLMTGARVPAKLGGGGIEPGAPTYIVMGGQEWPVIDGALRKAGFHWSSTIVWVKNRLIMSRKDYHTQYEPIWYGWDNRAPRLVELTDRKQSDVWMIDRPRKSEEHPTMKPVKLVERSINNSSKPGAIVLDLFAGSGTTLIACERLGRVCRTMDNDPKYVSVVLERYRQMTGQMPELEES